MKLTRVVETQADPMRAWAYLSDFTTTNEWDPGTVETKRVTGDGGVGSTYRNVSKFLGRKTELTYQVLDYQPGRRLALVGRNKSVVAHDTITLEPSGSGTRVTYEVDFDFQGFASVVAPLVAPALKKLADDGQAGMEKALARIAQPS